MTTAGLTERGGTGTTVTIIQSGRAYLWREEGGGVRGGRRIGEGGSEEMRKEKERDTQEQTHLGSIPRM